MLKSSAVAAASFLSFATVFNHHSTFPSVPSVNAVVRNDVQYTKSSTGLEYYDYRIGDGEEARVGDKVTINVKGYLAGRQGWLYEDTYSTDEPVRLTLGDTPCIRGLELGIVGNSENGKSGSIADITSMKKGGKRRLVIPSRLGYQSTNQEPIPRSEDLQRRLYSTVLNQVRSIREKEALGDSIVGKIILDIELVRVKHIN